MFLKFILKLTTQPEILSNVFFMSFQAWGTNEILVAVYYFLLETVKDLILCLPLLLRNRYE